MPPQKQPIVDFAAETQPDALNMTAKESESMNKNPMISPNTHTQGYHDNKRSNTEQDPF